LRHEAREQVRAALAELPERQRACLLLRHAGHSYAEIAATLGVAVGSVGVLLARAERAFRDRYRERYPELLQEALPSQEAPPAEHVPPSQAASPLPGAPASRVTDASKHTESPRRPHPSHDNVPSTQAAPSLHSLQEHTDDRHLP
jgi:DNA-binding CsgD family transcriptional regulator